jgi:Tol biopolymer transport system component
MLLIDEAILNDRQSLEYIEQLAAGEVFLIDADGAHERQIAPDLKGVMSAGPIWNASGQHAFISGYGSISIIHADGRPHTTVSFGTKDAIHICAEWSPDGQQLVFVEQGRSTPAHGVIGLIGADGSGLRRLADLPEDLSLEEAGGGTCPQWSPDGQRIGMISRQAVSIVQPDRTIATLRFPAPYEAIWQAVWSPDGRQIAFGFDAGLAIINRDGTGLRTVQQGVWRGRGLIWSADGQHLMTDSLLLCAPDDWPCLSVDGELSIVHINGAAVTHLPLPCESVFIGSLGEPAPNGQEVLIQTRQALYRAAVDGSALQRLAPIERQEQFFELAHWSPDGSQVAFVHKGDIYVVDRDGSQLRNLTQSVSMELQPTWSPDGHWLAFTRSDAQGPRVWTIRANGADQRLLTSRAGKAPVWLPAHT